MEDIFPTTVIVSPLLSASQQPSERGAVITPLAIRPADIYRLAQSHIAGVQNCNSAPQGKLSAGPGREAARQRLSFSALPTALHFLKDQCMKRAQRSTEEEGISSVGSQGGLLEEVTLSSLPLESQELQHIEKQSGETSPGGRTQSLPAHRGPRSRGSHGSFDRSAPSLLFLADTSVGFRPSPLRVWTGTTGSSSDVQGLADK